MIRTIKNAVRTLLFQAQLPSSFWVEALHTSVHILNLLPSKAIANKTPLTTLFKKPVSYSHLRVFGCLCYPNQNNSTTKKLSPRSSKCILLGYPQLHRGYRCFDLSTKKIIISHHVTFDESTFPYKDSKSTPSSTYEFLEHQTDPSPIFKNILQNTTVNIPPPVVVPADVQAPTQTASSAAEYPRHSMTTRSKRGIRKQKQILSLLTQPCSPLPKSHVQARLDPFWDASMTDEYNAIMKSQTFDPVPRQKNTNIVRSLWLHKHKYDANGVFKKHKSRLVANGKSQEEGVDFSETFSPVVKLATIRSVLHVALANHWQINQLDVQNAFLHGNLDEDVYMFQPPGFVDKNKTDYVCKLKRALYGLKQAPRAWNARFVEFITKQGFMQSKSDASLFVYRKDKDLAYILLYVDDIIITSSSPTLREKVIEAMKTEFPMSDCGLINSFLGISAIFNDKGLFLNQTKYAEDIIQRAGMQECKPVATPVDLKSKLGDKIGTPLKNPTEYRSLAGALQYLTFTRPDIAYAVQQICLFMHDPRDLHMQALRRILRYLQGTKSKGLQLLRDQPLKLTAYTDADWAGRPTTRQSTSGFCLFLGDNLISWSAKRQPTSPDQAQKLSTRESPMLLLKLAGYAIFYWRCTVL